MPFSHFKAKPFCISFFWLLKIICNLLGSKCDEILNANAMIFLFLDLIIFSISFFISTKLINAIYQDGKALVSAVHFDFPFSAQKSQRKSYSHCWDYGPENGPHTWEGICRHGRRQSPVDIRFGRLDFGNPILEAMKFVNYNAIGNLELKNNGHGVIVNGFEKWPQNQRPYIEGGELGSKYFLLQFHFHWATENDKGSEHALNGLHYPVEVHFVHVREGLELPEALKQSNGIAAVGVFYQTANEKKPSKAMSKFEDQLEFVVEKNSVAPLADYSPMVHLPKNLNDFFRYNGSLTTPECEEAVVWTIMANPVQISLEQLNLLRKLHGPNGSLKGDGYMRPLQPLNGRLVRLRLLSFLRKKRIKRKHF